MKYKKGSFITVPNREQLEGIPATAQCLFMWLCYHANQDGKCFPSRKRLAELCCVSIDMIDKMVKILEEKTLLLKTKRKKKGKNENHTNIYEILIGGVADTNGYLADHNGEGLADHNGSELNPLSLTQSTEEALTQKTGKFIQDFKKIFGETTIKKEFIPELKAFADYWTEPNKSRTKLRFEMEKTWDMKRRFAKWMRNKKDWSFEKKNTNKYQVVLDESQL
jgi:hypothetical protein